MKKSIFSLIIGSLLSTNIMANQVLKEIPEQILGCWADQNPQKVDPAYSYQFKSKYISSYISESGDYNFEGNSLIKNIIKTNTNMLIIKADTNYTFWGAEEYEEDVKPKLEPQKIEMFKIKLLNKNTLQLELRDPESSKRYSVKLFKHQCS